MIEFLCPEGHKIRCPKEKAGRSAKCPRCGVGFRIPTIEELGLSESKVANASLSGVEVTDAPLPPPSSSTSGKQLAASEKERQIEFLCPNGHHLHGPASLQGRAGECPECGSRFRIPIIEEPGGPPEPGASAEDEISLGDSTPAAEPDHAQLGESLDFLHVLESGSGPARLPGNSGGAILDLPSESNGARPAAHPLATLFIGLWAARGEDSRVEVHLESGGVITPDGYVRSSSLHDYAVLVTRDPDGCSTVTVVPWNSIARIIIRALKQVPGEVVR
jgi:hypothetical protein